MKISSVAEMRAMDRTAIEQYGIADELLMENAGEAAYFCILQHLGISEKRFLVFCGDGNNGGDGLVIARKILSNGGEVSVIMEIRIAIPLLQSSITPLSDAFRL